MNFDFKEVLKKNKPVEAMDDSDENEITHIREPEPVAKGLKKKYVYYAVMFLIIITIVATAVGLSKDGKKNLDKNEINQVQSQSAVEGDHLINIPKDYTEEAKYKKKHEEAEKKNMKDKDTSDTSTKKNNVPSAPKVPKQPAYSGNNVRRELTPAEKAKIFREEQRQEALKSPIGFEFKDRE